MLSYICNVIFYRDYKHNWCFCLKSNGFFPCQNVIEANRICSRWRIAWAQTTDRPTRVCTALKLYKLCPKHYIYIEIKKEAPFPNGSFRKIVISLYFFTNFASFFFSVNVVPKKVNTSNLINNLNIGKRHIDSVYLSFGDLWQFIVCRFGRDAIMWHTRNVCTTYTTNIRKSRCAFCRICEIDICKAKQT